MPKPEWYIAQVETGRERLICRLLEHVCEGVTVADGRVYENTPYGVTQNPFELTPDNAVPLLEECFSPMYMHRLKVKGEWVDVEKRLLPGYIVVVTTDPAAMANRFRAIPKFSRLLPMMKTFVPLREDERTWLDEATKPKERIIPISIAYRKGDSIVVTEGPLKGREGMVTRIIRKKCVAVVEIHAGNKTFTTEVGLAVIPEEEAMGEGWE